MTTKKKAKANNRITIQVPNNLTKEEATRLVALTESKRTLLCKALEANDVPVTINEDTISFPWFISHDIDGEVEAYSQLITAMVKMAKEQKRIVAKDKAEENEKFAMRIFLVRLGLKGDNCKLIRKLMSRNLSGNSSWKNGKPEKAKKKDEADQKPATPEKKDETNVANETKVPDETNVVSPETEEKKHD